MRSYKNKTIIEHIPDFLDYCEKERKFLPKSIENYYRFLKRFVTYLKDSHQEQLLPYQLSNKHIWSYKLYLLKTVHPVTRKPIGKVTKNLYLIALRALLHYFLEKDISSLLPNRIKLLKQGNHKATNALLSLKQLKKLFAAPDISKINGLRDRALLEILLSTGLKINQLVTLNKKDIEFKQKNLEIRVINKKINSYQIVSLSESATYWLKKYLNNRSDGERAMFINYQGRKRASRRLTDRSIERIIKKYVTDNNLPSSLTPETLRDIYILYLFNRKIKIKNPLRHKVLLIESYNINKSINFYRNSIKRKFKSSVWHIVENIIDKESLWLKEKISIMPPKYRSDRLIKNCDDCFFRRLAILIVSGRVKATEFKAKDRKKIWNIKISRENSLNINRHGKEWHQNMMNLVSVYFKAQNHKVILEPTLNFGRADLGVISEDKKTIYIEVGTVSLFKIWYNLSTMKNIIFLLIPSKEYIIEFRA